MKHVLVMIVSLVVLQVVGRNIAQHKAIGEHCIGAQRLIAQSKDMPPPGNPDHKEPAPGAYCHWPEDGKPDGAGDCDCHKTCYENNGPDGEPDGSRGVQEDHANCRSNCFASHCHCPAPCL